MAKQTPDEVRIAFSQGKSGGLLIGSLAFCLIGIWMFYVAWTEGGIEAILLALLALVTLLFFGAAALFLLRPLVARSPGLILNQDGFIDYSSALAAGFVPWEEVAEIGSSSHRGNQFISVVLNDPHQYIASQNLFRRGVMSMNKVFFRTPIQISTNVLDISFPKLQNLFREYKSKYGR